ncbi:MAG: 4Fe-4S binding protein [Proteobacteria bacterium]|nr:4Fe-4S binding protein [Pseudomonadota bacterium]
MAISRTQIKRKCIRALNKAYEDYQGNALGPHVIGVHVWTAPDFNRDFFRTFGFMPDIPSEKLMLTSEPWPKSAYKKLNYKEARGFEFNAFENTDITDYFVSRTEQIFGIQIPEHLIHEEPFYPFDSLKAYVDYIFKLKNGIEIRQEDFGAEISRGDCENEKCNNECQQACGTKKAIKYALQNLYMYVDSNLCTSCGECIKACPGKNIYLTYVGHSRSKSKRR